MGGLNIKQLEQKARDIREDIVRSLGEAGSGHPAGSLGLADVFSALYFKVMRIRPDEPSWPNRDVLFLSNGHCVPVQYSAMAGRGFFDKSELLTLRKFNSRLQGHPERSSLPGIESTSGPLGCGLAQASGYAYSLQYMDRNFQRYVYCVLGDGELDEGNIWESAMFASKYGLRQLIAIVDRNSIQLSGKTEDIMPLENLHAKWSSFGWHVQEVDGHNIQSIVEAISLAKAMTDRPSVIIAHTTPGKGVDFMEDDYHWHGKAPNSEQVRVAIDQLQADRRRM